VLYPPYDAFILPTSGTRAGDDIPTTSTATAEPLLLLLSLLLLLLLLLVVDA